MQELVASRTVMEQDSQSGLHTEFAFINESNPRISSAISTFFQLESK